MKPNPAFPVKVILSWNQVPLLIKLKQTTLKTLYGKSCLTDTSRLHVNMKYNIKIRSAVTFAKVIFFLRTGIWSAMFSLEAICQELHKSHVVSPHVDQRESSVLLWHWVWFRGMDQSLVWSGHLFPKYGIPRASETPSSPPKIVSISRELHSRCYAGDLALSHLTLRIFL